ncbi:hypothetical protein SISNIDRAFT_469473 [Sistotremastrum niveocremeum HHB9708]|uniref:Uncharacterized protein n=2 Tax=Sistotremastraceae TaxID=3402574 RepID=A0A164PZT0_9AGAM|nr:hypothetical protein SISNIDRAFT_469473 [Sistotremastrum niveocremeum HHB9708]KZT33410.1 hypothetical protein SISSUDRAFT_1037062 [Sistotremastrum suecicum HHB10207 ss-3]
MYTPAPKTRGQSAYFGTTMSPVLPFLAFTPQRSALRAPTFKSPRPRATPLPSRSSKTTLSVDHLTAPPSSPLVPTHKLNELGLEAKAGDHWIGASSDIEKDAELLAQHQLESARERCVELRARIDNAKKQLELSKAIVKTQEKDISHASDELRNVEEEIGHWRGVLHDKYVSPALLAMDDSSEMTAASGEEDGEGEEEEEEEATGKVEGDA